jgi:hypothetical protein
LRRSATANVANCEHNPARAGLGLLGALDRFHLLALVAVAEPAKTFPRARFRFNARVKSAGGRISRFAASSVSVALSVSVPSSPAASRLLRRSGKQGPFPIDAIVLG